jgi:hypothetical protein
MSSPRLMTVPGIDAHGTLYVSGKPVGWTVAQILRAGLKPARPNYDLRLPKFACDAKSIFD